MSTTSTKTMVLELLNNYSDIQLQISILRYEMEHPTQITFDDTIEALSFGHPDIIGSAPGHVSNKTLYIALNYRDKTNRANAEARDEIAFRLNELEQRQARLNHYINLLDENEAAVIRMTYIEGLSNEQIASVCNTTKRTITARRHKAIEHLCEMFDYMRDLNRG